MSHVPKMNLFEPVTVEWHPISFSVKEIWNLAKEQKLILRPDFQRRAVWSEAAQISLIDTVIRNLPMPKVFFANQTKLDGNVTKTTRLVIDGQQRLTAIFHFLEGRFVIQSKGPDSQYFHFSELPDEIQARIYEYKIDANDILSGDDSLIREIYSRVNKYNIALNQQELRRADFPGAFLRVSERLSESLFFERNRIFTALQRRRMLDVEFTSELLAILISGIQNKKERLDSFFQTYQIWNKDEETKVFNQFQDVITCIDTIFEKCKLSVQNTRFRQKSDFYSLFASVGGLHLVQPDLEKIDWTPLSSDLKILDNYIAPESPIEILSTYAVKCVSDANSAASRLWRTNFLTLFLSPTICGSDPSAEGAAVFAQIRMQIPKDYDLGFVNPVVDENGLPLNFDRFDPDGSLKYWVGWSNDDLPRQMVNMRFFTDKYVSANGYKHTSPFLLNQLVIDHFDNSYV
jgi:hypothetical protein